MQTGSVLFKIAYFLQGVKVEMAFRSCFIRLSKFR